MKSERPSRFLLFGLTAVAALATFGAYSSSVDDQNKAQQKQIESLIQSVRGPDLYRAHCAPCHGADGSGNGPVAPELRSTLPDLTTIAHRSGGLFPEERVRNLIAADELVIAHGNREMPIWGPIFHQIENDRDYGEVRMRNLIEYLRSIQQK
jgi:mono/diheme cytochrome c family protein